MARAKESKRGALRSTSKRRRHTRGGTSAGRRSSPARKGSTRGGSTPLSERLRRTREQAKTPRPTGRTRSTGRARSTERARSTGRKRSTTPKQEQPVAAGSSPLRRRAAQRQARTPAAARTRRGALRKGVPVAAPSRPRSRATSSGSIGSAGGTRTANLQMEIEQLRTRFARLQAAADLGDIQQSLGRTDARLAELPRELAALRSRGYVHAGLLDEEIGSLQEQWQQTRPEVEDALQDQARALNRQAADAARTLNRLSVRNAASLSAASAAVSALQSQVNHARSSVRGLYSGVENQIASVEETLEQFGRVLEQFDRSPNVRLRDAEAPLLATEAEWYRDGDEGPQGLLFLTDQRLLFEQNEEVATEKLFGLFTTESDQVQRLLLDIPVHQIEKISHGEEGGFLGIGKQEILELILGARAPVSRARFHIQGQDAADWAVWLKRVQTQEIDRDRAEAYMEEVEAAASRTARFPTKCPSCFAPLPTPPRGARTATCDYCGTVVKPLEDVEPS